MPGHFGTDEGQDGAFANTTSASKSGAFFKNDATAKASAPGGSGVFGLTMAPGAAGVFGANNAPGTSGVGVQGNGPEAGVSGWSENGNGLRAFSSKGDGLYASTRAAGKSAIFGNNEAKTTTSAPGGSGVFGLTVAPGAAGVFGANNAPGTAGVGVQGNGPEAGVSGWSERGIGVRAVSGQLGLFAQGGNGAAQFVGNVKVTGDLAVTGDVKLINADCAERFDLAVGAVTEPGTVMVIEDRGALRPSLGAYDSRVAGVVSGAGNYQPAMLLDDRETGRPRPPIALIGKVFCKVDAREEAISVGDLLTTSELEGHAMKASDSTRRPGAIIGKALAPLAGGLGLIPILVALQ